MRDPTRPLKLSRLLPLPRPFAFSFSPRQHLQAAGLTTPNLWFGVYDFNDEAKTGNNWRLLDEGVFRYDHLCPLMLGGCWLLTAKAELALGQFDARKRNRVKL